ncbi:DOPA 4,5-dioxygenase family protein [Vibrio scophthalmi]|uniref:DOPA 4,5-dioxygenase family protein n=1 Tax=Vibrio scophthalmi TaxID=45658 RepID=UPI0022848829|nr:DOPA 4,5-dioxygenase family protein [Vibrio scophthalmi]MCY9804892.1 DOPA 4,5-dioxygenase family protein [Vibrio scophthalmi]
MTFPINQHQNYHAHFYFDQSSSDYAAKIRDEIHQTLGLFVGRFNQRLVGPHTQWSFEIDFDREQFDKVIDWLDNARQGHSVLVHAVTEDDYRDHTEYVYWLGEPIALDLTLFSVD